MNQILVSEKLYVTPSVKRKRVVFKGTFFISIFSFVILASYGIYATYDRNRAAAMSGEILANMEFAEIEIQRRTIIEEPIIVILNDSRESYAGKSNN